MRKVIGAGIAVFAVAMLILVTQLGTGEVRADIDPATIDFETGLSEGDIVSSVSCGAGMTCSAATGGSITVFGDSANPGIPGNAAMIFDATCAGGCSGGDNDLFKAALGNVLIISEDLDSTDPDDADLKNAFYKFDFSGWGPGTVCVDSIDILDVESVEQPGSQIELFAGGEDATDKGTFPIPATGNNGLATVFLDSGVCGVDFMRVTLNGSGAIDNIAIELENGNGGGEGCTPGFWKNHLDAWGPTGLSPGDDFDSNFGVDLFDPDITKEDAVNAKGGGVKKLARHGMAALLNALHPDVDYLFTAAEVIALVQAGDVDPLVAENELTASGFCD